MIEFPVHAAFLKRESLQHFVPLSIKSVNVVKTFSYTHKPISSHALSLVMPLDLFYPLGIGPMLVFVFLTCSLTPIIISHINYLEFPLLEKLSLSRDN